MSKAFLLILRRCAASVEAIFPERKRHGLLKPWKHLQEKGSRRCLQALAACLMAVVMLGADGGTEARFNRAGHNMICMCGCGQILLECNHVGCPVSPKMISELQTQVASGLPQEGVFNWFVAKYGAVVLASPSRGGFDRVAWIMPLSVTLLATLGTGVLVRLWTRRRGPQMAALGPHVPGTLEHSSVRDRIRRETEF